MRVLNFFHNKVVKVVTEKCLNLSFEKLIMSFSSQNKDKLLTMFGTFESFPFVPPSLVGAYYLRIFSVCETPPHPQHVMHPPVTEHVAPSRRTCHIIT